MTQFGYSWRVQSFPCRPSEPEPHEMQNLPESSWRINVQRSVRTYAVGPHGFPRHSRSEEIKCRDATRGQVLQHQGEQQMSGTEFSVAFVVRHLGNVVMRSAGQP